MPPKGAIVAVPSSVRVAATPPVLQPIYDEHSHDTQHWKSPFPPDALSDDERNWMINKLTLTCQHQSLPFASWPPGLFSIVVNYTVGTHSLSLALALSRSRSRSHSHTKMSMLTHHH
jgi:hypothetical protein